MADRFEDHPAVRNSEAALVRELGERIGYGRTMQLCERLWREREEISGYPGAEHSVGCCVAFLVECPSCRGGRNLTSCDWCCGAGRVTKRVAQAIRESGPKSKGKRRP